MIATIEYINSVKIIKNRSNPFNPGITNVNEIPEKKRIMIMAKGKNTLVDFPTSL